MHKTIVEMKKYKDVAKEYGISYHSVTIMVNKALKKAKYIEELVAQRDLGEWKRKQV